MKKNFILVILAAFGTLMHCTAQTIITKNSVWKYKADGTDQGTAWRLNGFNDAAWSMGAAELGYGDNPATSLTPSKITYYFRKSVNITNPLQYIFTINLRRDDGIIVYINGTERIRNNMPAGTVDYNTPASANAPDDGNTVFTYSIPASAFLNGTNIIAAEVHNNSTTSSDLTFELELFANSASIPVITRGPYIQSTTAGSTILKWRTNIACDSKVQWGASSSFGRSATDAALATDHQVQVTGLTPNTKYFYSIGTTAVVLQANAANFFWTAPPASSTQTTRIWAIGDFGNGSTAQTAVLNAYLNYLGPNKNDMWLWLGDNAYESGTDAEYQNNVFAKYGPQFKSWNFYPSPGNHDYGDIGYLSTTALGTNFPYFSIFNLPTTAQAGGIASGSEKYYSYNWGNIHFISLDSYGAQNTVGSPMYNWLRNDLMANTQKWTIAYWHHAPYSKGTHNSDTERELINMRTNIVPLLETHKADLVLNGHSHTYERSYFIHGHYGNESSFASSMIIQPGDGNAVPYIKDNGHNGTVYAVCGVSGKSSSSTTPGYPHNAMARSFTSINGSVALEIKGDTLRYKFLTSTGSISDQFTMIKPSVAARMEKESLINDVKTQQTKKLFSIYPNPSAGIFHIQPAVKGKTTIEIFNNGGSLILSDVIFDEKTVDLSGYPAGDYIIKGTTATTAYSCSFLLSK